MASHDPEMGMFFQDMVPGLDLLPVARNLRMQKSVVLGMLFVVAGGGLDRHRFRGSQQSLGSPMWATKVLFWLSM